MAARKSKAASRDIRVRMYRQGLGDCFLISLPRAKRDFHMLVDCGVILGTPNPGPIMNAVANDIGKTTNDQLDVVIATHQHWDHLSGFKQARARFDAMKFKEVWFAWTEDPDHKLANKLRREQRQKMRALRAAMASPQAALLPASERNGIASLLDSFGLAAAGGGSTEEAIQYLKQRKDASVRYRVPGEKPIELEDVKGIRIYTLGPPEDEKLIKKSDPTKRGAEVYEMAGALTPEMSFAGAFMGGASFEEGGELSDLTYPFESGRRIAEDRMVVSPFHEFFEERYGFEPSRPDAWRRIDADWLGSAGELALALDGDTNNTSLALAIEIVDDGRVILLPADAQVGNWESWGALKWKVRDGSGGASREVSGEDLLRRTVLYKVGHHGSHNATLRDKGLELMESRELAAMIPVDHAMAKKKRWNMPFPPLFKRLAEKTHGRIMRIDDGVAKQRPGTSNADWSKFEKRVSETKEFIEYSVDL